jgi:SecD/SecF fusion protein
MKRFYWKIFWCVLPVVLSALIVSRAYVLWSDGKGGFKLGVDLAGGTILVYEVEDPNKLPTGYKPEELAASLKRRIDPTDLYNVTIRPVGRTRVEIILPTGGRHQAEAEETAWQDLLTKVKAKWPPPAGAALNVPQGKVRELITLVKDQHPDADTNEIESFVTQNYGEATGRRHLTTEEVDRIKALIAQVGSLEFRILANSKDDEAAIKRAKEYFGGGFDGSGKLIEATIDKAELEKHRQELDRLAREGKPPPPPQPPDGNAFDTPKGRFTYSWVELDREERKYLNLDNASENDPNRSGFWKIVAEARKNHKPVTVDRLSGALLFSRASEDLKLPPDQRQRKKYEYFLLTRDPERGPDGVPKAITGQYLTNATEGFDEKMQPAVHFSFDNTGGQLFYDITSKNRPDGTGAGAFYRFLAITLDGKIVSAPSLNEAIRNEGRITGDFTREKVNNLVTVLRSGALPATLKPQPVSENTMGAQLGQDTIVAGTYSVLIAFVAVLLFMLIYYRFAGLVACIALLANLLLTVAFMVAVNATFTLPGLAGLVLTLGMAVDANVLIYERLREERDRGANLALAVRNGYDRAFPTIIDTHLSSIFTAIVLYAVGNDQLKGFGISLTVGLAISLFTSLYMTRLMFDIWQYKGWLKKLSMFRFLTKTSWDFMAIRYYWFTATIILTIVGAALFIYRLDRGGLNIDFTGGTAYGGRLNQPLSIQDLRDKFSEQRQKQLLHVVEVKQRDTEGRSFALTYEDPDGKRSTRTVDFPNTMTAEEVQKQAASLPDLSVEQIFSKSFSEGDRSQLFTVRTSEKAPQLVQTSIDRLLGDLLERIGMKFEVDKDNKGAMLDFTDYASPAQVSSLLERQLADHGLKAQAQQLAVVGQGDDKDGRFKRMHLELSEPADRAKLTAALQATETEFASRPQPERLENFDSQLARDTQLRAMYAILASWMAILLYLWFRFGNWTFGLAAVACLIHDLFFTLGIIAFSHYVHGTAFGNALLLQDFKIDLPAVAALLTLVGYSVSDTIVVFDRIREVRGKNPLLTPQMINDSVNQTLSRTILTATSVWLVVFVLYVLGGEGIHLFAFVMVIGVIVGTYSSIYIASPLLLIFGEGSEHARRQRQPAPQPQSVLS